MRARSLVSLGAIALMIAFPLAAQSITPVAREGAAEGPMAFSERYFTKEAVKVAMRDGVELPTMILRPRVQREDLPVILLRTPYAIGSEAFPARTARFEAMAREGYIFVIQEQRGTASAPGTFVLTPPLAKDKNGIDEATDAFDTVDWIVKQLPRTNGRVGVTGCSYGGYSTVMAGMSGHPAVRAISPQASMADLFRGDDIYWNGIPLLAQAPYFVSMMDSKLKDVARLPQTDAYEWYLHAGALKDVQPLGFANASPTWDAILANDHLTGFWDDRDLSRHAAKVGVPSLTVLGWFDVEDFPGPLKLFQEMDRNDHSGIHRLTVGPWRHCQWLEPQDGTELGPLRFATPTAREFREDIEARFFAFYLKDKGSLDDMPQVMAYETGDGGGWRSYPNWPDQPQTASQMLYLAPDRMLATKVPDQSGSDSYISDPMRPVPYAPRPIPFFTGSGLTADRDPGRSLFVVADQRFAGDRPDVVAWTSAPLEEDMVLTGKAVLDLFASTTSTDVDWIVQLIDIYPESHDPSMSGYRLQVSRGALRASLRDGLDKPRAIPPGKTLHYVLPLENRNHRFAKNHRIMVQLQSSWFPYLARNPQKFVPAAKATNADFTVAQIRIFRGEGTASRIALPIRPAGVRDAH